MSCDKKPLRSPEQSLESPGNAEITESLCSKISVRWCCVLHYDEEDNLMDDGTESVTMTSSRLGSFIRGPQRGRPNGLGHKSCLSR